MSKGFAKIGGEAVFQQLVLLSAIVRAGRQHDYRRVTYGLVRALGYFVKDFFPTYAGHHIIQNDQIRL